MEQMNTLPNETPAEQLAAPTQGDTKKSKLKVNKSVMGLLLIGVVVFLLFISYLTGFLPIFLFGRDEYNVMQTIPKYPSTAKEGSTSYSTGFPESSDNHIERNFFTNDPADKVVDFYYSALKDGGWDVPLKSFLEYQNTGGPQLTSLKKKLKNQWYKLTIWRYPVNDREYGNRDKIYTNYVLTVSKIDVQ